MLEWHRREEKSSWWEYFRLCELSDEELQEDRNALGGLAYVAEVDHIKRSTVHRYRFPPQDHAIDRAHEVHDPRTGHSAGTVVAFDDHNRTIDLKRGTASQVPHPTALVPFDIVGSTVLSDSLFRLASYVAEHGIAGAGQFQPARELLLRQRPRALGKFDGTLVGEDGQLTPSAKALVRSLARETSVLPIQGPPGSGKTFTGGRMIVELVSQGRRVGVTAASHKVVSTLLREVCSAAKQSGVRVRMIQKASEGDECDDASVIKAESNEAVLDALTKGSAKVAAGSAWLWAREEMANSVDVLFVDEAGQMSLANVLAASPSATSIVLLGDPQQLDQPQKGVHPPGADVSALSHLLNGRATIADDQGIFLTETRRLHPDVCAFTSEIFYEGRLVARPENAHQRLNIGNSLGGTGLRFAPVLHSGNQNESPEEVEKVAGRSTVCWRRGNLDEQEGRNSCPHAGGHPHCRSLQRAGRGTDRKTPRRGEGRNGGQVPRAGSTTRPVLDGDIDSGGRATGNGVPVQPQPPERRGVACPVRGCDRRQPGAVPSAVQDTTPDRACERFLSLSGNGSSRLTRSTLFPLETT